MEIKMLAVRCDELGCGFRQEIVLAEFMGWHHKPCPECGKGEIISDHDVAVMAQVVMLKALDAFLDPGGKMPRKNVHIDSAKMRG
jgi:hypothetical protein